MVREHRVDVLRRASAERTWQPVIGRCLGLLRLWVPSASGERTIARHAPAEYSVWVCRQHLAVHVNGSEATTVGIDGEQRPRGVPRAGLLDLRNAVELYFSRCVPHSCIQDLL